MITRAVGVREAVELEETELVVLPRDVFLLCTDGFYNMVSAPEATELFKAANDNLETLSSSMINAANQSGGFDNITVLLAQRILPPVPGEDAKETLKG
jgi:protein phosphatase